MELFLIKFCVFALSVATTFAQTDSDSNSQEVLPRYLVFPGVDADLDEIGEWSYGFASPFNLFFGPKPYVLGWMGEAPFGPGDGEDEEPLEGEEGELEGEDPEDPEEAEEEEDPDYDYER